MRITVLGTGSVGRTLAPALERNGHAVVVGTRDPAVTLARPELADWGLRNPHIQVLAHADLPPGADVVVNATDGNGSLEALRAVGAQHLAGAVLLDVANALDFSAGMPPRASSVAEVLQAEFPAARVVKALNSITASVMVDPTIVPGEHTALLCGDDQAAKDVVVGLLVELGWPRAAVLDLGGINHARGLEQLLPTWFSLVGSFGHAELNLQVRVRPATEDG